MPRNVIFPHFPCLTYWLDSLELTWCHVLEGTHLSSLTPCNKVFLPCHWFGVATGPPHASPCLPTPPTKCWSLPFHNLPFLLVASLKLRGLGVRCPKNPCILVIWVKKWQPWGKSIMEDMEDITLDIWFWLVRPHEFSWNPMKSL